MRRKTPWVGFDNYVKIAGDEFFRSSLGSGIK
jgi:hypothetical protein